MRRQVFGWALGALGVISLGYMNAGPDPVASSAFTVVDSAGKEIILSAAKLTGGTRRLAWLVDLKGVASEEARKGPLALELREPNSTTFQKGVSTLIPLNSVESVRYDYAKQIMMVSVKGSAEPIPGTLQFKGINVIALEGLVGGTKTKMVGGAPKEGFRSLTFSAARPVPAHPPGGLVWSVRIEQPKAGDPQVNVRNLKALYSFPGGVELLFDSLPVRKGESLPLNATLKKLELLAVDLNTHVAAAEVTTEAVPEKLTALVLTREQAGRTGTLIGLVGEVDVGWKLFPLHTVKSIAPTAAK